MERKYLIIPEFERLGQSTELAQAYDAGFEYFDTTLKKPIWKADTKWVDATGTEV